MCCYLNLHIKIVITEILCRNIQHFPLRVLIIPDYLSLPHLVIQAYNTLHKHCLYLTLTRLWYSVSGLLNTK